MWSVRVVFKLDYIFGSQEALQEWWSRVVAGKALLSQTNIMAGLT